MKIQDYAKRLRIKEFFLFGVIGSFGAILNTIILYLLTFKLGLYYVISSIIATEIAILTNFIGNNLFTFKGRGNSSLFRKFINFQVISIFTVFLTVFLLWSMTTLLGIKLLLIWNIVAIGITFLFNFILNIKFTWKDKNVVNSRKKGLLKTIFFFFALLVSISAITDAFIINDTELNTIQSDSLTNISLIESNSSINTSIGQSNGTNTSAELLNIMNSLELNSIIQSNIEANDSTQNFTINGTLFVDSYPQGATVLINGTNLLTPDHLSLSAGEYNLSINKTGYGNENHIITITDNQTLNQNYSLTILAPLTSATSLVAVSQLGFHPNGIKQVIVYTSQKQGTFNILKEGVSVFSSLLSIPKDAFGTNVSCQGNQPCLVGDFSNFSVEGSYTLNATWGLNTPSFVIDKNIYKNNLGVFFEFFNALQQQNSDYHADLNSGLNPPFVAMADGSFIMESHQASKSLIRLGSAYNRNPALFSGTQYGAIIKSYVGYLVSLQGLSIQNMSPTDPDYNDGFRLNALVKIDSIFYPGPVPENITSMNVYSSPGIISDPLIPVTSLCGSGNPSNSTWKNCIDYAADYYKCQINEPCVNATYIEKTGRITGNYATTAKYGVSTGWSMGQEFGCFIDSDLQNAVINNKMNPCFMFLTDENPVNTASALLGYLEALPALYDEDPAYAQQIFTQSVSTYNYIRQHDALYWQNATSDSQGTGFLGASEFLLYDYTLNASYLQAAYAMRTKVDLPLISDATQGNEFYWEEYIRHKAALVSEGLIYKYNNADPEDLVYQGTLWEVWSGRTPNDISQSGERVFQFDNQYSGDPDHRINFQSSRYILTMGLIATKTDELHLAPESFNKLIADNQLAWITGMNSVQDGVSLNSTKQSYSFIFGIGQPINPKQFHSRYLVNTGFSADTVASPLGQLVGVRGSSKKFFNGTDYNDLDGTFSILGNKFGSPGNGYNNETPVTLWRNQTFNNGKTIIPGWINGAFDNFQDPDTIWNYEDNKETYEYTESTNEIVATAIELFAYADGQYNNRVKHTQILFNTTLTNTSNGTTIFPQFSNLLVTPTSPAVYNSTQRYIFNATIIGSNFINNSTLNFGGVNYTVQPTGNTFSKEFIGLTTGNYNYSWFARDINGNSNQTNTFVYTINPQVNNSNNSNFTNFNFSLNVQSIPTNAPLYINSIFIGLTPQNISLSSGNYTIITNKTGFLQNQTSLFLNSNISLIINLQNLSIPIPPSNNSANSTHIISSSTNLQLENEGNYNLIETNNASFSVNLSKNDTITWMLNNVVIRTANSNLDSFIWNPGILYTSNFVPVTIKAVVGNESKNWTLKVINVINPFFTDDLTNDANTLLHVFTNNNVVTFTNLSVKIQSDSGSSIYFLDPVLSANETDWKKQLTNLDFGNTYIVQITGYLPNNNTLVYNLGTERAHYRSTPQVSTNSGGGGGGGSSSRKESLDLVYLTLSDSIISQNQTEIITLDAKSSSRVQNVEVFLLTPDRGLISKNLTLVNGNKQYGTWAIGLEDLQTGLYTVNYVRIKGSTLSENINVANRTFYVVGPQVSSSERLILVYTILDKNRIDSVSNATVTLDARDNLGINSIKMHIKAIHGKLEKNFTVNANLVSGDKKYGTWNATFSVNQSDTTYVVDSVTLTNSEESKTYLILERSVYGTTSLPKETEATSPNLITGSSIGVNLSNTFKGPFAPVTLAFIIVVLVSIVVLIIGYFRKIKNGKGD